MSGGEDARAVAEGHFATARYVAAADDSSVESSGEWIKQRFRERISI